MALFWKVLTPLTLVLWALGGYWGLVVAPPEKFMGEAYRILYVHVPAAWIAMVCATVNFVVAIGYLFGSTQKKDAMAEASGEVTLLFTGLLLVSGSIWGRITWGVWWSWDPRLTTAAIMFFTYAAYMAMRRFVEDPDKRATWSAVVAILAWVNIPVTYMSVKWWASLHQLQSSPETIPDADMQLALRLSAFAFLGLMILFIRARSEIAMIRQQLEFSEPPMVPEAN